jgi:hypothetical protein
MNAEEYRWDVRLPQPHPTGCRLCGIPNPRSDGAVICRVCEGRVFRICDPARADRAQVLALIRVTDNPNVLALALANALGDWRRAALSRRLERVLGPSRFRSRP